MTVTTVQDVDEYLTEPVSSHLLFTESNQCMNITLKAERKTIKFQYVPVLHNELHFLQAVGITSTRINDLQREKSLNTDLISGHPNEWRNLWMTI